MNYRHAFHAGNFADVLKHVVLTLVIAYLKRKPAPFRVIDTHAGTGLYDLDSEEAARTGEWQDGIGRLLAARARMPREVADLLGPYLGVLEGDYDTGGSQGGRLKRYPGSPLIARRMLRDGDQLVVNELHPEDRERLADLFHRDRQTKVLGLDGFTALKALLPPKERRGVVLVDPPFEVAGEFDRLAGAVREAQRRFASGIVIVWYPIKDPAEAARLHERLRECGLRKALCAELQVADPGGGKGGLAATGVAVVNPPFTLEADLRRVVPFLAETMAQGTGARGEVSWIVAEAEKRA